MKSLVNLYWRICFFQASPGDVPYSIPLLAVMLFLHVTVQNLLLLTSDYQPMMLLATFANTALMVLLTYLFLFINRTPNRAVQTATALTGVDVLVGTVFLIPASLLLARQVVDESLFSGAVLAIVVWNLFIAAHILSKAMNVGLFLGLAVAFTYTVSGQITFNLIVGPLS